MSDAILLFTFSPIQSFIVEARRAADLFVGSQILVELARAAADAITVEGGTLIYPVTDASATGDKSVPNVGKPTSTGRDTPNKLVARVPTTRAKAIAEIAQKALERRWYELAEEAAKALASLGKPPDDLWWTIWKRQTTGFWETYWSAAEMYSDASGTGYSAAYDRASRALDATKRTRVFAQVAEPGRKDTLSGRREALHTAALDAVEYWSTAGADPNVTAAKLRPDGRERLDGIGSVKRFCGLATRPFPSSSTVASWPFMQIAQPHLKLFKVTLQLLLGAKLHQVRANDPEWPYDGDLLYLETLTPERLLESYGARYLDEGVRVTATKQLREAYGTAGGHPALYYGIVLLDGDNMGARVNECLTKPNPEVEHRRLSSSLSAFADTVRDTCFNLSNGLDAVIYNGGDDVLALAPLATVVRTAQTLAAAFEKLTNGSASAGVAIVHHTYPLDAALRAAHAAEREAKGVDGKAAVCVRVVKRGGEALQVRSSWAALGTNLDGLVAAFRGDPAPLASRLAFDAARATYALPEPDAKWQAEMRRLIARHRNPKAAAAPDPVALATSLATWAAALPGKTAELADWLIFARFLTQGGGD